MIKNKKNQINIEFNKSLYVISAVKQAAEDFSHLADFKLSETKKKIKVKALNINDRTKVKIFADEFANYVLAIQGVLND
jgi:hypothetical protein